MDFVSQSLLLAGGLFLGMLFAMELGRRHGRWRMRRDPDGVRTGTGAIEGAVFGLLGLILAFTFSGAAGRFDTRRQLVAQEANAIGTAWLRIDLLPPEDQPALRDLFRRHLDVRLAAYSMVESGDPTGVQRELEASSILQNEIWSAAERACTRDGRPFVCTLVLPAVNEMLDVTTTRTAAARTHVPPVVFVLLVSAAILGAALAGHATTGSRERHWFHAIVFAAMTSLTVLVIYDLEYPRQGLIRIGATDQVLIDLRASFD